MLVVEDALAEGQVFNVGSGRGVTVLDFVRVLAQKTNTQISPEIPGVYRMGTRAMRIEHFKAAVAGLETEERTQRNLRRLSCVA